MEYMESMMQQRYDSYNDALAKADEMVSRLEKALEWALNNATDSNHPHFPYKEGEKWVYPYLVIGTPMGGGVGDASFTTALAAVEGAMSGKVTE